MQQYFHQLFSHERVMRDPRTKSILGFDRTGAYFTRWALCIVFLAALLCTAVTARAQRERALKMVYLRRRPDVNLTKELMRKACENRAQQSVREGRDEYDLTRLTPLWFVAQRDYNKQKYGDQGWDDAMDLTLTKGQIVIAGDDVDGWRHGYVRGAPDRFGMFPARGGAQHDDVYFVRQLAWEEVAGIVREEGLHALVQAEHRFDRVTYDEEWDDDDHEFMKGEFLVLPREPGHDGWAKAIKLEDYSKGLHTGAQAWEEATSHDLTDAHVDGPRRLCKKIPATRGFVRPL